MWSGINTAIASRSGGFQGIGFAIPSNEAKFVYAALKNKGKVTRGWLGVSISDVANDLPKAAELRVHRQRPASSSSRHSRTPPPPASCSRRHHRIESMASRCKASCSFANTVAANPPGTE